MDKDSNAYTFLFAGGLVVIVGAILSTASMGLKDFQVRNVQNAKMQDILEAANIEGVARADSKDRFMEVVTKRIVLDSSGQVVATKSGDEEIERKNDSTEAFNIDPRSQLKNVGKGNIELFALFALEKENGETNYVVPMAGSGLWGPIWGYISLEEDMNTVAGAVFDHDSETPGLGAEIATKAFQEEFKGKKVFEGADYENIQMSVIKGTVPEELKEHAVDGVTGGTVTSHGVRDMIQRTLAKYKSYFKEHGKKAS